MATIDPKLLPNMAAEALRTAFLGPFGGYQQTMLDHLWPASRTYYCPACDRMVTLPIPAALFYQPVPSPWRTGIYRWEKQP